MTATSTLRDDPAVRLFAIQLSAKRTEQGARAVLSSALAGPGEIILPTWRSWRFTADAEKAVYTAVRRYSRRTVIPLIPRRAA